MRYAPKGQVRLTPDEIAIAITMLTAPGHALLDRADARAAVAGLREAGALGDDDALANPVAGIVRVIAGASLRIELRVWHAGAQIAEHRAWADDRYAVVGDVTRLGLELTRMDPPRLPLALALRLGLGSGDHCAGATVRDPIEVVTSALAAVSALAASGDREAAGAVLREHGVEEPDADRALALAEGMRVVWSATSSWREPGGELHAGALSALDAGASGWWRFEPGHTARLLEPTDPEALWRALHALVSGEVARGENIPSMSEHERREGD